MKQKTVFACQECGAQSPKWLGRCNDCGAWNSFVEERQLPERATAGAAAVAQRYSLAGAAGPQLYADIDTVVAERLSTGVGEFDRVLGGGVVPGSLVLIGGEPGTTPPPSTRSNSPTPVDRRSATTVSISA